MTLGSLAEGHRAECPRCGHVVSVRRVDWQSRAIAFAIAAAVLLVFANSFPFLSLRAGDLENVMTLPQTAAELYGEGYWTIAVLVMAPTVVIPALVLAILAAILVPLRVGRSAPWLVPGARLLNALSPWSMVEVFVIGVMVSLVKIGAMAKVTIGISFWAYVGFALCFTAAIAALDRVQLWREIEEATR